MLPFVHGHALILLGLRARGKKGIKKRTTCIFMPVINFLKVMHKSPILVFFYYIFSYFIFKLTLRANKFFIKKYFGIQI